ARDDLAFFQLVNANVFQEVAVFFAEIKNDAGDFVDEAVFGDEEVGALNAEFQNEAFVGDARFGGDLQVEPDAESAHQDRQEQKGSNQGEQADAAGAHGGEFVVGAEAAE